MAMPLRPQHFVSRQDGTLTALIAVDELPSCITIQGVPRVLNQSDTQGMTSLGTIPSRGQNYVVDYIHQGTRIEAPAPPTSSPSDGSFAGPANPAAAPAWRNTDATGREMVKHNSGPRKGNGNASKKEYCSFWLRHGECDYQQQGCIFKHEMPTDIPTLEKLGLRDIPRWYREKYGLKSITAGGGTPVRADRVWRGDVQAASHSPQYSNVQPRYIMPAATESDGRASGQVHYAPAIPAFQAPGRADIQAVNDRNGSGNMPLGSHTAVAKDTHDIRRSIERPQMFDRLDLLTQDELSQYRRASSGNLAFQDGLTAFRDPSGPANYPAPNNRNPTMSRAPQAISKDSEKANDEKPDTHLRTSKPTDGSIWTVRDNLPHDFSTLTMAPMNTTPQPANQGTEQNGNGKRRNQRSRRLYQARATTDGANPHTRPASETAMTRSDKQSDSPSPIGSTPPGKQSEKKKVKAKNVSGPDSTTSTPSEQGKTPDTSSGGESLDDDPFGLKLES